MLSLLFINVGIPLLGVAVGWLAKKLHVQAVVQEHEDTAEALRSHVGRLEEQLSKQEAITPVDRKK